MMPSDCPVLRLNNIFSILEYKNTNYMNIIAELTNKPLLSIVLRIVNYKAARFGYQI